MRAHERKLVVHVTTGRYQHEPAALRQLAKHVKSLQIGIKQEELLAHPENERHRDTWEKYVNNNEESTEMTQRIRPLRSKRREGKTENAYPILEKDLLLKNLPFQRKVFDDKIRLDKARFNTKSCLFLPE